MGKWFISHAAQLRTEHINRHSRLIEWNFIIFLSKTIFWMRERDGKRWGKSSKWIIADWISFSFHKCFWMPLKRGNRGRKIDIKWKFICSNYSTHCIFHSTGTFVLLLLSLSLSPSLYLSPIPKIKLKIISMIKYLFFAIFIFALLVRHRIAVY